MNAKFFDAKKYDLTPAGRYKLGRKLNVIDRIENHVLAQDLYKADGSLLMKKGTLVHKEERNLLREELTKGSHVEAFPFRHSFSHPTVVEVETKNKLALVGRILANDLELKDEVIYQGTALSEEDVKKIAKEFKVISVYSGIISKPVELTRDNIDAVIDYGQRFFILARITDKAGDVMIDDEPAMPLYIPDHDSYILMSDKEAIIRERISKGER